MILPLHPILLPSAAPLQSLIGLLDARAATRGLERRERRFTRERWLQWKDLREVEEGVHRGWTALGPLPEAVAVRAAVVGGHIERARRAALDDLCLDPTAPQRPVDQRGGDGRPPVLVGGARFGTHAVVAGAGHDYV